MRGQKGEGKEGRGENERGENEGEENEEEKKRGIIGGGGRRDQISVK